MSSIIIANWKMNINFTEAIKIANSLEKHSNPLYKLVLAPPAPYLAYFANTLSKTQLCAQDISVFRGFGAYTGETSADIIKSCSIHYALIGHSERRSILKENDKIISTKIQNCIDAGIIPIVCVGESLEDRKNNTYRASILKQIQAIPTGLEQLIIAYEPIWAIGSGLIPSSDEIKQISDLINNNQQISLVAKNMSLLYGGSVTSKNCQEIIKIDGISGMLIGSASLKLEELKLILN